MTQLRRRTVLAGLGALGAAAALPAGLARAAAARMNVAVVLIDDLTRDALGCYGNPFNETPNIDRLAADGVRFTDGYSAAPVCSPTRASIMTGQYPARVGITDFLDGDTDDHLSPDLATLPSLLHAAGYRTGLVGKWHLAGSHTGPYRDTPGNPFQHGFDEVLCSEERYIGPGDYFFPYNHLPQVTTGQPGEYLTDRLNREAAGFVERAVAGGTPFFLYLAHYATHTALAAPADLVDRYRAKPGAAQHNPTLAAMLEVLDDGVGALRDTLRRLAVDANTVIVLMADNGGEAAISDGPFRDGKRSCHEGGIRVPVIVYWPGTPAGRVFDTPISTIDVLPTVLGATGVAPRAGQAVDGVTFAPLLTGGSQPGRSTLFWIYPHHNKDVQPQAAVRRGRYKLWQQLRDGRAELFDVVADPGEQTDLAATRPALVQELTAALTAHIADTKVLPPHPTPQQYPAVVLSNTFATGVGPLTVLAGQPQGRTGTVDVAGGALTVHADGAAAFALLRSQRAVPPGRSATIVTVKAFAGAPVSTDTVLTGLIQDADNSVLAWYNHAAGTVGWNLRLDGTLITERIDALTGTVDLPSGARLALALQRDEITLFTASSATDEQWQYLFTADLGKHLRLEDPAVRSRFRFGFGVRIDGGALAVDDLTVRTG